MYVKAQEICPLQNEFNFWHHLAFLNKRDISQAGLNKVFCGIEWKLGVALLCIGISVDEIFTPKISVVILLTVCHTSFMMLAERIWYWIN